MCDLILRRGGFTRTKYRKLLEQSEAYLQPNISIVGQYQGVGGVAELRFCLSAIAVHPTEQLTRTAQCLL